MDSFGVGKLATVVARLGKLGVEDFAGSSSILANEAASEFSSIGSEDCYSQHLLNPTSKRGTLSKSGVGLTLRLA